MKKAAGLIFLLLYLAVLFLTDLDKKIITHVIFFVTAILLLVWINRGGKRG